MKKKMTFTVPVISLWMLIGIACGQSGSESSVSSAAGVQKPRPVSGQVLTSPTMPPVRIEFDRTFKYVGSQSFVLYDVANAEQHFFAELDKEGRVKRFYWIQFEGYLPNNSHSYNYQADKVVNIGGLDFIADARPLNIKTSPSRENSDGSKAREFLESKGHGLAGDDILMQRLVHLVDEAKRNELMVIYIEDLSGTGLTAADLAPEGRAAGRWEEMSKGLLERAQEGMKIVPLKGK